MKLNVSGGTVVLRWTGTAGVLYQAESASSSAGPWQAIGIPTTDFAVSNVLVGPSQMYRVGIFTNTAQYTSNAAKNTGDTAAPTIPTGLAVYVANCSQVNLSWNASTDQGTKVAGKTVTSGLQAYSIYRGGVFLKQVLMPATSTTDTNVAGSTTYSYSVLAIDNAGNSSSLSSPMYVTTPSCPSCTASINAISSPSVGGSASGGSTVNCGSIVTLTAAANPGYSFANWTENGTIISGSASYPFSASGNRTLVANFSAVAPTYVTISTSSSPSGSGGASGGGTVTSGSGVTVSASANLGYTFANWTENGIVVSTSANYTFSANANRTLVANFNVSCTYAIASSVLPLGAGVTGGGGLVNCGSSITMTAAASTGYTFASWSENGSLVSTSPIYTFSASASRTLVANFTFNSVSYTITTSSSPAAGGTTSVGGSITAGSAITVTAMPNTGYNFVNWTENGTGVSSASSYTFNVNANRNLVANFSAISTSGPWAKRFGGIGNDSGSAVAVDAGGNILLAGSFKGTADFEGSLLASAGGADMVLAKYNNAGVHQWSYRFGGTGDETVKAIALDATGNIFVAGYFTGSANLGGATFTSAGQYNAFVAKYSATGQHLWSKSFGSTTSTTYINLLNALAVDSQGNVVVTGTFQGDASFGGVALHSLWGTAVSVVLAKYSSDGTHLWSKTFTSGNESYVNGIAIDRSDNILLTGSFFTSINFASNDGLDRTITTAYPTYQNIFVAKFTKDGANVWAKRYGGAHGDKGFSVAADSNGDVIVGGMFYKQTDLGNGTITGSALDLDSFVAKYSGADGSYRWAVPIVGDNGCWVNAVKVDVQNNVVLTGFFYGTFTFGGQTLTSKLNSYDGYIAKYNSSGGLTWASGFGGAGSDGSSGLAIDGTSHPIVTGAFNGSATIGGLPLVSAGMGDAFLMLLNP